MDVACGHAIGGAVALHQRAGGSHRGLQPQYCRHRRGRAVEGPVQPTEGDQRRADSRLRVDDDGAQVEPAVDRGRRQHPERHNVRGGNDDHAQQHRPLAHLRRLVLQLVQEGATSDEAVDGPPGQAERPQLLGGRRVDRESVRVVGIALCRPHLVGVPIAPDRALLEQPVGRQPRTAEKKWCPPLEREQHARRRESTDHFGQSARDEVHRDRQRRSGHPQVELAGDLQIVRELGMLEVAHPRWRDARVGELVVEPGRGPVAEVGAERGVDGVEHLHEDEHHADRRQGRGQRITVLNGPDEDAHGDREARREQPPQHQHDPPQGGERAVGPAQHAEELPLLAGAQARHQRAIHTPDRTVPSHRRRWSAPKETEELRGIFERLA